jgi:hypothetical protein
VVVRVSLPSYGFIAWRGLFTDPGQTGPLVAGVAVSLAWAVAATLLAVRLFLRRDFTDLAYDGAGRRVLARAVLPLAGVLAVCVAVIAGTTLKNPVTGEDHLVSIVLDQGFIWKQGDCGQGTFEVEAEGIHMSFKDSNWILYDFDWTNQN